MAGAGNDPIRAGGDGELPSRAFDGGEGRVGAEFGSARALGLEAEVVDGGSGEFRDFSLDSDSGAAGADFGRSLFAGGGVAVAFGFAIFEGAFFEFDAAGVDGAA